MNKTNVLLYGHVNKLCQKEQKQYTHVSHIRNVSVAVDIYKLLSLILTKKKKRKKKNETKQNVKKKNFIKKTNLFSRCRLFKKKIFFIFYFLIFKLYFTALIFFNAFAVFFVALINYKQLCVGCLLSCNFQFQLFRYTRSPFSAPPPVSQAL